MKNKTKRKEIKKLIFSIVSVTLFLVLSTTMLYLPKQNNLLSSLAFLQNQNSFYMEDLTNGILLKNATPVKDATGLSYEPYMFKVVNNSNHDITYRISFESNEEKAKEKGMEVLANKYLRYAINETDTNIEANTLSEEGTLYTATIKANSETTFEFRMWLDYDCDNGAMNKMFAGKIKIEEL